MPAYQDYLARTQAAESVVILDGARTSIEVSVSDDQINGFPTTTALLDENLGTKLHGTYGWISDANGAAGEGYVEFTFRANTNNQIAGKKIYYNRLITGNTADWTCDATSAGTGARKGDLTAKLIPKGCM
nr:pilin [Cocleimonas flava]